MAQFRNCVHTQRIREPAWKHFLSFPRALCINFFFHLRPRNYEYILFQYFHTAPSYNSSSIYRMEHVTEIAHSAWKHWHTSSQYKWETGPTARAETTVALAVFSWVHTSLFPCSWLQAIWILLCQWVLVCSLQQFKQNKARNRDKDSDSSTISTALQQSQLVLETHLASEEPKTPSMTQLDLPSPAWVCLRTWLWSSSDFTEIRPYLASVTCDVLGWVLYLLNLG